MQKQIVPDDGETSKREQQHGMQEVRRQGRSWCKHDVGKSTNYEVWCICQTETAGEVKGLNDMTVQ